MPLSPNLIPKKMNTFSVSISTCVVLGGQDMNVFSYSLDIINVRINIINTLGALNKPKGITLN